MDKFLFCCFVIFNESFKRNLTVELFCFSLCVSMRNNLWE